MAGTNISTILIICGAIGALLDIALHVLQLVDLPLPACLTDRRAAAIITVTSAGLIGLSLIVQFNVGALLITLFVGGLGVWSLVTGKELGELPSGKEMEHG